MPRHINEILTEVMSKLNKGDEMISEAIKTLVTRDVFICIIEEKLSLLSFNNENDEWIEMLSDRHAPCFSSDEFPENLKLRASNNSESSRTFTKSDVTNKSMVIPRELTDDQKTEYVLFRI